MKYIEECDCNVKKYEKAYRVWIISTNSAGIKGIPSALSKVFLNRNRQHGPQSQQADLSHGLGDLRLVFSGHKLGVDGGPQQQREPSPPQDGACCCHQLKKIKIITESGYFYPTNSIFLSFTLKCYNLVAFITIS